MDGDGFKVGTLVERNTPLELSGEQLQHKNVIELVAETSDLSTSQVNNDLKDIDYLMNDVYPVKKSRLRKLFGKENVKDNISIKQPSSLKNVCSLSDLVAQRRKELSGPEKFCASAQAFRDDAVQAHQTQGKFSIGTFRSVTELSSAGERPLQLTTLDLHKALKVLAAKEPVSASPVKLSERLDDPSTTDNFCSESHVAGQKIPLDLTLKTYMRLTCSMPLNWFYKSIMRGAYNSMPQFTSQLDCSQYKKLSCSSDSRLSSQGFICKTLHSWIYPQSTLPPSLMAFLTSSAAGGVEMDFLRSRRLAWEDSFRNLYYMFRKNVCSIFYVCTSRFVVMFAAADGLGSTKRSCNAYMSQSTRSLRSVLIEQDVCFSMPLCRSKVEQATAEDLIELSEIEKLNLGQIQRLNYFPDIDNTPESLLAFSGNENVHGLYEVLLNYRSLLTSLAGMDVPVLYSPLPFQNAALSTPEVRYLESRKAGGVVAHSNETVLKSGDSIKCPSTDMYYSIELKDAYLPPWTISSMCAVMVSEGTSFAASFTTEHTSTGLNIALEAVCEKPNSEDAVGESSNETANAFGLEDTIICPHLYSGLLKGLNYCSGSYTVSLTPV